MKLKYLKKLVAHLKLNWNKGRVFLGRTSLQGIFATLFLKKCKNKRKYLLALPVLILFLGLGLFFHLKSASAAWFDENWLYRKAIEISNTGILQTDFQVSFTLNTSSTDTSGLIYQGKMKSDCSDIRITDGNGKILPYWIEDTSTSSCDNLATKIWTKIPFAFLTGTTIYLYYGNPAASSGQDPVKVFEFFEDFSQDTLNPQKWTTSGTPTISSGVLSLINHQSLISNQLLSGTDGTRTLGINAQSPTSTPSAAYLGFSKTQTLANSYYSDDAAFIALADEQNYLNFLGGTANLISYHKLEETVSTDANQFKASGFFDTGKLGQAVSMYGNATGTTGSTLTFNSGALVSGSFNYEHINTNQGTISFWFKPSWSGGDSNTYYLFDNYVASGTNIRIYKTTSSNRIYFDINRGGVLHRDYTTVTGNINSGSWYHVVARWDTDNAVTSTYLMDLLVNNGGTISNNGDTDGTDDWTANSPATISYIGSRYDGQNQAQAFIDDFAIFDRVLSTTEITALYGGGTSPKEAGSIADPSLKFYAKMDGSGTLSPVNYNTGASASKMNAKSTELTGGTNLLANSNFESGMTGWSPQDSNQITVSSNSDNLIFDTRNLKIQRIGAGFAGMVQTITVSPSTTYHFSAWIKDGVGDGSFLFRDTANSSNFLALANGVTDSTWTKYESDFKTAANATTIVVYLYSGNNIGDISYFDNIILTPNLIDNGGMEGTYSSGVAPGWTSAGTGIFSKEGVDIHSGSGAQKIQATSNGEIYQNVTVTAGQTYLVTAWIKILTTLQGGNGIGIYDNTNGVWISPRGSTATTSTYVRRSGTWTPTTTGSHALYIGMLTSNSSGDYIVDDVSVIPLDNVSTSLKAWTPIADSGSANNPLSINGNPASGVQSGTGKYGNGYTFDGSTGYLRQKTYLTNIGDLSYSGNTFIDSGQTFTAYKTSSGNASYMIVITNSDNTTSWGYIGNNSEAANTVTVYTTKARSTAGWLGTSPTGKTPVGYEVRKTDYQITGNLTVGAWVKTSVGAKMALSKYDYGTSQRSYQLSLEGSGWADFRLSSDGTATVYAQGTTGLADNNWHYITGVYTPNTSIKVYVDGILINTNTTSIPASLYDVPAQFIIGARLNSKVASDFWSGSIDSPFVLDKALTASEIKQLYLVGAASKYGLANSNSATTPSLADSTNSALADTNYHTFEITQKNGSVDYSVDGGTITTSSTNTPTSNQYIRLENTDSTNPININWVYLRKSYSTNPSASVSAIEQQGLGPVGYWKLDEGQGQVVNDSTSNKNNGTLGADINAGTDDPTWQTEDQCISGKCLYFDGVGDYINVGNVSSVKITGSLTMEAWIRTQDTGSSTTIMGKWNTNQESYWLGLVNGTSVRMYVSGTGSDTIYRGVSNTGVNDNKWHHIVAVYSTSQTVNIYIDGKSRTLDESSGTIPTAIFDSTANLQIAMDQKNGVNASLPGFLDDIKIYPYARSASQIKADYNSGLAGASTSKGTSAVLGADDQKWMSEGLVGYWKMDEATGSSVIDFSGNSNTGTLTNAQETGTAQVGGSTTTLVGQSSLSSTDDVYNGMILNINGGTGCLITAGTQRTISDYTGSSRTISVATAFANVTDNCGYVILHQVGGKYGNGVQFDKTNDVVNINKNYGFTNAISISMWVKLNNLTGFQTFLGQDTSDWTSNNGGIYFQKVSSTTDSCGRTSNKFSFTLPYGTICNIGTVQSITTATTGTWYHLVGTYDGSAIKIYVNGVLEGSTPYTRNIASQTGNLSIGSGYYNNVNADYTSGSIDDVRIYNRALSPAEVSDLYNWAPGPVGQWEFEGNINDVSGYSSTAAWNGSNQTRYSSGKFGQSGNFTGLSSKDYISVTNSTPLNFTTGSNFTFAAWINRREGGENLQGVVGNIQNGTIKYGASLFNSGHSFGIQAGDGLNTYLVHYFGSWVAGKWTHVEVVYENGTFYNYVNGIKIDSWTAAVAQNNGNFAIGRWAINYAAGYYNNGLIDDVKIYNYARTQKQIVEDMNGGHPAGGSPVGSQLAYYKFDEGYGQTANNSGNGGSSLNGTLGSSSSSDTNDPAWTMNGKFGKALSFDGSNDYVDAGTSSALNITGPFTVSAWVNINRAFNPTNGQYLNIVAKNSIYTSGYGIELYEKGTSPAGTRVEVWSRGTSLNEAYYYLTSNDWQPNQWHQVTGVYDGTNLYIYLDGKLKGTNTGVNPGDTSAAHLLIGDGTSANVGDGEWPGSIDEVKIYSYALTADEVKLDYNQGKALVLGSLSDTSGITGGSVASSSASAAYCIPGDTATCNPPVGEWNFEEKSGVYANDTSGNGNTGTLGGDGVGGDVPSWTVGKIGSALSFDGGDFVDAGNSSIYNFSRTSPFTISAWVKYSGSDAEDYIVSHHSLGTTKGGYVFFVNGTTNTLYFDLIDSSGNQYYTTYVVNLRDGWHYLTGTYDGSQNRSGIRLYVDSNLVATGTNLAIANDISYSINLTFGKNAYQNNYYFPGIIDQIRIYNYARTPAQIAWDYNNGKPIAQWKMDECQGTTIHDSSGNNYTGTLSLGSATAGTCTDGSGTSIWSQGAIGKYNSSLYFDGSNDKVSIGTAIPGIQAVSFWVKPSTNTDSFIDLDGGTHYITSSSGVVSATGFSTPSIYVNGVLNAALNGGAWNHIVITTGTSFSTTTSFTLGYSAGATDYLTGQLDDVRVYNYALTGAQVQQLYNGGAAVRFAPITGTP